ncbi:cryptochrome-2-like isoform X1 [Limulus polyphemus]|uniref:Cryptochrome-2-like isoform X1 n=2 Tax=Limulus polyphemus TaxID=6850 RepID=A0ABM1SWG5_LIMPO|nr:cryptochrome-2-like isoform X1 [Limulus polyphemus]
MERNKYYRFFIPLFNFILLLMNSQLVFSNEFYLLESDNIQEDHFEKDERGNMFWDFGISGFIGRIKTVLLGIFSFFGKDMKETSVHWFRKGLRLHDNPALMKTLEKCGNFRPIFILDPWFVKNMHVGPNRWRFLLQSLKDLDNSLNKLHSRLFVIRGKPLEVFPKIFQQWNVKTLTYEVDTEPYAIERDEKVDQLAKRMGVTVKKEVSHTLYDIERLVMKNNGSAPHTYQAMLTMLKKIGPPPKPVASLDSLKGCSTPVEENHDEKYNVPDLKELGIHESDCGPNLYSGGETEALRIMNEKLSNKSWVCKFEKPKTQPNSLEPSTTVLSPYLKFGCLSVRTFYYRLLDVYNKYTGNCTKPPVSLEGQLLWREFFYTVGYATPNFDQMKGNPLCKQIPWSNNPEFLEAWTKAQTGFPFIDAIMTQLRQEGWIHHLARHAVACFLTRGDLWVSWEHGMKVFEEFLLDADWSLNAGNWMWLSASAFFHQYFRVYSPVAFGKSMDKNGDYIRKYLPVLKKMPSEYIYEPWKAPLKVQQQIGCVIGKDYPKPIVDHDEARKSNLEKMNKAYKENKTSNEQKTTNKRSSEETVSSLLSPKKTKS